MLSRELRAAHEVLLLRLALERLAHALGGAVHRGRQRAVPGARERADEVVAQPIGTQGREPHLAPLIGQGRRQVMMSFSVVGLEAEGFRILLDRLLQLSLSIEGIAQVIVHLRISGLDL